MPRKDRERWLLVSDCQVLGLGNCLNMASDRVEVELFDPHAFRREAEAIDARLSSYDRVLAAPQIARNAPIDLDRLGTMWTLPQLTFNAFHPDICTLQKDGVWWQGPLSYTHSVIAFAAYRSGLDPTKTASLYCAEVYEELGYFRRWDVARDQMLATFRDAGYDLAPAFVQWTRGPQAFMYTHNHPRIAVVRDLAHAVLARAGITPEYAEALPVDNLANSAIYPVYPEIAAHLGVTGGLLFKRAGRYEFLRLQQFIEESFAAYREAGELTIRQGHEPLLEAAMTAVGRRA